ncbi:hypothetical protein NA57DRAFT_65397 [Rhizodiscina lignyota]|uniref:Saccharopine dehydrogenase NADP binding domain-containing protein n=1 Tax=Rhizodiscina lignyota TaxID=1504668 RepID=A0A9P4M824_9PEZI|nr:hypothetical protein NA57DRAFT_65397 [Rhizodiscina lignyota]
MAVNASPEYDLILLGATGFTGKLCAEYITQHLPTDLKWAVAGRNWKKLSAVVDDLKSLNADRKSPEIEIAELSSQDLDKLARKARVIITTIGPYHLYGTPVVEACAKAGTHYIDCTGETPWVYHAVQKYHETAKASGAILIPLCGIESAPADVTAYLLASHMRSKYSSGVAQLTHSIQALRGDTSGGTLLSALTIMDSYSVPQLRQSRSPFSLALSRPQAAKPLKPLSYRLFGSFRFPGLGLLTDSLCGVQDRQLVYRTWSLLDGGAFYGPKFTYSSWMRTKSRISAFVFHFGFAAAVVALLFKPLRWLLKKLVKQPGEGPPKDQHSSHFIKVKALATSDSNSRQTAECTMSYSGDMYYLTGLLMSEAAMVLLRPDPSKENWAQKLRGGFLTPATLGEQYVERLRNAGMRIEVGSEGEV